MNIIISKRKDNIMTDDTPMEGGAVKPSQILGAVSAGSGAVSALAPIAAPIALPLSILSGLAGSIAGIFGGGLTQSEVDMLHQIKSRVDQRREMRGVTGSPAN